MKHADRCADGDYIDDTGRVFKGREAIEKSFAEMFTSNKGVKLRIEVESLRFPTADTAIEDGTTAVIPPDGSAPTRTADFKDSSQLQASQ